MTLLNPVGEDVNKKHTDSKSLAQRFQYSEKSRSLVLSQIRARVGMPNQKEVS